MDYKQTKRVAEVFANQKWVLGETQYGRAILVAGKIIRCSRNVTTENVADAVISVCHIPEEEREEGQKADFLLVHCPVDLNKVMKTVEGTGTF